jgi:hypothetical protein
MDTIKYVSIVSSKKVLCVFQTNKNDKDGKILIEKINTKYSHAYPFFILKNFSIEWTLDNAKTSLFSQCELEKVKMRSNFCTLEVQLRDLFSKSPYNL